jgi:hypothetical protein
VPFTCDFETTMSFLDVSLESLAYLSLDAGIKNPTVLHGPQRHSPSLPRDDHLTVPLVQDLEWEE